MTQYEFDRINSTLDRIEAIMTDMLFALFC